MSKLAALTKRIDDLKQKVLPLLTGFSAKLPFLKKFLPKEQDVKAAAAQQKASKDGLISVYHEGNTSTRLAVFFVFILFTAFLYFGGSLVRNMWRNYRATKHPGQLEREYTTQFAKEMEKVASRAAVISVGKITSNAVHMDGREAFLNVDIWATCDNPETAKLMENIGIRTHDIIINVFRSLYDKKISIVTEEGREKARSEIIAGINKVLPSGKILTINFYNLVIE